MCSPNLNYCFDGILVKCNWDWLAIKRWWMFFNIRNFAFIFKQKLTCGKIFYMTTDLGKSVVYIFYFLLVYIFIYTSMHTIFLSSRIKSNTMLWSFRCETLRLHHVWQEVFSAPAPCETQPHSYGYVSAINNQEYHFSTWFSLKWLCIQLFKSILVYTLYLRWACKARWSGQDLAADGILKPTFLQEWLIL